MEIAPQAQPHPPTPSPDALAALAGEGEKKTLLSPLPARGYERPGEGPGVR